MSFSHWLRHNTEHYLLIAAQDRVARQHGARRPRPPHGLRDLFWLRFFAPIYRALPWPLRHKVMLAMPGSHRRQWAPPPRAHGPAVHPHAPQGPTQQERTQQERKSGHGTDRG